MKSALPTLLVVLLLCAAAPRRAWGLSDAVLNGVVRDAHGTPQMGALVELLGPDATTVARAFTDDHGRYLLRGLLPGVYQLRASAAFLLPTLRDNLHLRAGTDSVADLTMTAIFEAGAWLPTERRSASEASDDWRWTLRSTGNRPLLRVVGASDEKLGKEGTSSSSDHPGSYAAEGQLLLAAGDGSFGEGGARQILTLDREDAGGDVSALRAKVADTLTPGQAPTVSVAAGLERNSRFGGGTRVFISFSSHPEFQVGGADGAAVWRSASTETLNLGDAVMVDVGTLLTAEHLLGTRLASTPYLRAAFQASPAVAIEYRLATDRVLQSASDLDGMSLREDTLADQQGRPLLRKGLHQELAATYRREKANLAVAVFGDSLPVEVLQGDGEITAQDLKDLPIVADPTTGTLRMAVDGYKSAGIRVAWDQTFSPAVSACVEAEVGSALRASELDMPLTEASRQVRAGAATALAGSVHLASRRYGSTLNVRYRWQSVRTLTQVDEFDTAADDSYLGIVFRQRLWAGRRLRGVNAVVEATNLLEQGYVPVLAGDGETLYLAQVPRAIQGGLAFRF